MRKSRSKQVSARKKELRSLLKQRVLFEEVFDQKRMGFVSAKTESSILTGRAPLKKTNPQ